MSIATRSPCERRARARDDARVNVCGRPPRSIHPNRAQLHRSSVVVARASPTNVDERTHKSECLPRENRTFGRLHARIVRRSRVHRSFSIPSRSADDDDDDVIAVVDARRARVGRRNATNATPRRSSVASRASTTEDPRFALLFDCDGVIVETEELHRLAYNGAFEAFELAIDGERVEWRVEYYDVLQNTVAWWEAEDAMAL